MHGEISLGRVGLFKQQGEGGAGEAEQAEGEEIADVTKQSRLL